MNNTIVDRIKRLEKQVKSLEKQGGMLQTIAEKRAETLNEIDTDIQKNKRKRAVCNVFNCNKKIGRIFYCGGGNYEFVCFDFHYLNASGILPELCKKFLGNDLLESERYSLEFFEQGAVL